MSIIEKTVFRQNIDRKISVSLFLSRFTSLGPGTCEAVHEINACHRLNVDAYEIPIKLFALSEPVTGNHSVYKALICLKRQMPQNRFLSVFELLMMNWTYPGMQLQHQIVIPKFTIGPVSHVYVTENHQPPQFLSFTELFDSCVIGPEIWFAMTNATDVDRGTFEETLTKLVSAEQSFA